MLGPIEISPPHNCGSSGSYSPIPLGEYIDVGDNPVFIVKITSFGLNGTGVTANVVIEASADDGSTFAQVCGLSATSAGTFYMPVSSVAGVFSGGTSGIENPGTYSTPGSNQAFYGNRYRVTCWTFGTPVSGSFQFQVLVLPGSNNHLR
jgi:hypothetical protein